MPDWHIEHDVAAIQISNHGGRQLDSSPATIEALVEISEAVGGKIDIFLDGGVRCGADVLKALALGAKAVFLGKPIVYGLCYNGSDGVEEVLNVMKEQLIVAMKSHWLYWCEENPTKHNKKEIHVQDIVFENKWDLENEELIKVLLIRQG